MINPATILQLKNAWNRFQANHPKFPMFVQAMNREDVLQPGTILEIHVTTAGGRNLSTNVKLTPEDLELFASLKNLNHPL